MNKYLVCKVSLENPNDFDIHFTLVHGHERNNFFLCSLCPTTYASKEKFRQEYLSQTFNNQTNCIELSQC